MSKVIDYLRVAIQNKSFNYHKQSSLSELRVFHIGGYWRGPKDIVAQMLQGLNAICENVFEFNTDENRDALSTEGRPYDRGTFGPVWMLKEKIFPSILKFKPHIIICNAGGLSFRTKDVAVLRRLGIKLLGIALSDPAVYQVATSKIAHNFDVFFTNDVNSVNLYRDNGVRAYQLPLATSEQLYYPSLPRPELICDVLHLGSAQETRIKPIKLLCENFDTHVHGENWENYGVENKGLIFGDDLLSALSSASVVVVLSRTTSASHTIKPQIFDYLSTGSLVITDDFPEIHKYFEVGREILTFNSLEDMIKIIKYYLSHPEEAGRIRVAGREKVVNNFTWKRIWPELLSLAFDKKRHYM